jgi:hypothetical protein
MPLNIVPEFYEHDSFQAGWMPDLEPTAVPFEGLLDVNNLLPDRTTGVLETRKGVKRFSDYYKAGHKTRALHTFHQNSGQTNETGSQHLIVVASDQTDNVDNVQIYAINVATEVATRIDTAGRQWRHKHARHWGETIDNAHYGGSELDPMYCWRPNFVDGTANPHPWDPDASMGHYTTKVWTSGTDYDYGDRVKDGDWVWVSIKSATHTASDGNRPKNGRRSDQIWEKVGKFVPAWATATDYVKGDLVSYLVTGDIKFPRGLLDAGEGENRYSTFVALQDHTSAAGKEPTTGYWEPYRGPVSNVAVYHGSRLFVRDSDAGSARLFYSSPVKGDGFWDPTDWSSTDITKSGAFDVKSGDGDDIRGLCSLGRNLIIAKRRSTWVLSGINPSTWRKDRVGSGGVLVHRALTEHEGLVYMFSDQGLLVTDGAIVQEVPGADAFRDWIRDNVDMGTDTANIYRIAMWTFDQKIWIALPAGEEVNRNNVVLVFDPVTTSLWKLDLSVNAGAVSRKDRLDELFLATSNIGGALVMQYNHPDADDTDDIGGAVYLPEPIAWHARTGWLTFGVGREDRRIRRLWAVFRSALKDITWKAYRQWKETPAWTLTQTTGAGPVEHIEGRVMPDSHSVSFEFSGEAPTSLIGLSMHTEARRKRYHVA